MQTAQAERRRSHEPANVMWDAPADGPGRGEASVRPSRWLARSLARTAAGNRLETELRAIAVDLLGGPQPGELPLDCAEWLAATVDAAVAGVSASSLAALAEALDTRLEAAPDDVARRLREAAARRDAGYV